MLDRNNQRLSRLLCVCTGHYVGGYCWLWALFDETPSEKYSERLVQQFSYV